jgi:hypothetical protein
LFGVVIFFGGDRLFIRDCYQTLFGIKNGLSYKFNKQANQYHLKRNSAKLFLPGSLVSLKVENDGQGITINKTSNGRSTKNPSIQIKLKPVQPKNGGEKPISFTGTCGLNQKEFRVPEERFFKLLFFAFFQRNSSRPVME